MSFIASKPANLPKYTVTNVKVSYDVGVGSEVISFRDFERIDVGVAGEITWRFSDEFGFGSDVKRLIIAGSDRASGLQISSLLASQSRIQTGSGRDFTAYLTRFTIDSALGLESRMMFRGHKLTIEELETVEKNIDSIMYQIDFITSQLRTVGYGDMVFETDVSNIIEFIMNVTTIIAYLYFKYIKMGYQFPQETLDLLYELLRDVWG